MASKILALRKRKAGLKVKIKRLEARSAAIDVELRKLDLAVSGIDWDLKRIEWDEGRDNAKARTRKLQTRKAS